MERSKLKVKKIRISPEIIDKICDTAVEAIETLREATKILMQDSEF